MANLLSLLTLAALAAVAVSIAPLHKGDGTAPANDWCVFVVCGWCLLLLVKRCTSFLM